MVVSRKFLCGRCGLDPTMHSLEDRRNGICTRSLMAIGSHEHPKKPMFQVINESNEESINAAEQALQSLLVIVRSLGLNPAQFLQRTLERENRKAEVDAEVNAVRRVIVEPHHRLNPDEAGRLFFESENPRHPFGKPVIRGNESIDRFGLYDEYDFPLSAPRGQPNESSELRSQIETADAIERTHKRTDKVRDD